MVRKKKKTSMGGGQPVRFYKVVALGFLFITIVLLGLIVFMSSKRATITILTRPEPIDTTFSVDVGDDALSKVTANVTSTIVTLEKSFSPNGVREEVGTATGLVTLHNDSSRAQPLVATTRLLTPEGILFRLKSGVTVPANGTVDAEVYADKEGENSNIKASSFTIPGLNGTRQTEVYAKSQSDMTGGIKYIGVVSSKDVQAAETQLREELEKLGKEKLQNIAGSDGVVYKLVSSNITTDAEVGVETSEFILKGNAKVVGVVYSEEELKSYAQANIDKQIVDTNEVVHQSDSVPHPSIDSVDEATGTATLLVSYAGMASLDQNSKDLQKLMFYGKTEDEVRRYVLSLDHVTGVEVKFKPIWNKSVPHVADHLTIVVRQVE